MLKENLSHHSTVRNLTLTLLLRYLVTDATAA